LSQVIIENPILNTPFAAPNRHFKFDETGITNEIAEYRRTSAYFIPIAQAQRRGSSQPSLIDEWTSERIAENTFINEIRMEVQSWRSVGRPFIGKITKRLLEHWENPQRDRKLFFCQIEALETAIYITEAAAKMGRHHLINKLHRDQADHNPELFRIAFKMATGSGKTVVMAMLIAWQTLNKAANTQDARFSDAFLLVAPGVTIRDRLRVLLPSDDESYYRAMDLVPPDLFNELGKAKIVIANFHAFKLKEKFAAGKLTKSILQNTEAAVAAGAFTETPDQMARRVCRELGNKKNIIVINDEAHHCYQRKIEIAEEIKLKGDDKKDAEQREEEARIWINGLKAVKQKLGVKIVYDLSATPFFLRGSGFAEGTLFPWVVSDFALIDAIESGIVKVPRVPVSDDSGTGDQPTYRNFYPLIREALPKKGRKTDDVAGGEPKLPAILEGAIESLYSNYKKHFETYQLAVNKTTDLSPPPVLIVVCPNTNVSKLVFDYISGWEKQLTEDQSVLVPGKLPIFSNVQNGQWIDRPNTILIDSKQLESGEPLSPEFKKIAEREIEEFKLAYSRRFAGRSADKLDDGDILREVMNTVGKPGKLGGNVKCVVSVSMLTEGWDANTVTHVLGVRAFSTQLLCEQVVGRALRRRSYAINDAGMFEPEYAEIFGVPFSFIPCSGSSEPKPGLTPTRVRALEERIKLEITFPRVTGYRYELATQKLNYKFTPDSYIALSTRDIPTITTNRPIVGQTEIITLNDLKQRRDQEVVFLLAKLVLEKYFRADGQKLPEAQISEHKFEAGVQMWLFPQVMRITKEWLSKCVTCKDNTFPQLLLLLEFAHDAADKIYHSILAGDPGEKTLKPILRPYDTVGSTRYVDFDTTKPVFKTNPEKCHVSYVANDTKSWEQKMAEVLEELDQVKSYVKNQGLGFFIPYTINGEEKNYIPDFIARIDDGKEDLLNLIVEVSGENRKDKAAKTATARNLWVPAINNDGNFGRWQFIEITDPWDAKNVINAALRSDFTVVRNEPLLN
jgi:type III restriction enzyme